MRHGAADLPGLLRRAVARGGPDDPYPKTCALAELAVAVASVDGDRCRALLRQSGRLARGQALALTEPAQAALSAGDTAAALELALSVTDERRRMTVLLQLMRAAAPAGVPELADRAEALLWSLSDPEGAAQSAADLAVLTAPLDSVRARSLADYAEGAAEEAARLPPADHDPEQEAWTLSGLAKAAAALGASDRARAHLDRAAALVRGLPEDRALLLSDLAETAATTGDRTRAHALIDEASACLFAVADPYPYFLTALELAGSARTAGDPGQARALAVEAALSAPAVTDPYQQALAWTELARTAPPGDAPVFVARAHALLPSVPDLWLRTRILTRTPDPVLARELLSSATAPWPVCLSAALLAFPALPAAVLRVIADDVLAPGPPCRAPSP